MPQQMLDQLRSQTEDLRGQIKSKREQLIGGSPGQTEIAGNMMEEVQSRMSERFDVMQERRPRVLSDIMNVNELPIDVTGEGGGILERGRELVDGQENVEFSGQQKKSRDVGTGIQFSG